MNTLIIDGNYLYYRSVFASFKHNNSDMRTQEGVNDVVKKFLIDLVSISNRIDRVRLILVFDQLHNWREEIYPQYKKNRDGSNFKPNEYQAVKSTVRIVENIAREAGINVVKGNLCEGDDVIWYLTQKLFPTKRNVIFSEDRDLTQLISDHTKMWNGTYFITKKDVDTEWVRFKKILLGDSGDNVMRCLKPGIGEVAVKNAYKKYGDGLMFLYDQSSFDRLNEILKNGIDRDKMELNSKLIMLHEHYIPLHIRKGLESIRSEDIVPSVEKISLKMFNLK